MPDAPPVAVRDRCTRGREVTAARADEGESARGGAFPARVTELAAKRENLTTADVKALQAGALA